AATSRWPKRTARRGRRIAQLRRGSPPRKRLRVIPNGRGLLLALPSAPDRLDLAGRPGVRGAPGRGRGTGDTWNRDYYPDHRREQRTWARDGAPVAQGRPHRTRRSA